MSSPAPGGAAAGRGGVDARDGADRPGPAAEAEAARDAMQREGRRLDAAVEELVAQGLSREQVLALLDLP